MNPLLEDFNTPYDSVCFEKIKVQDYRTGLESAIKQAKAKIAEIKAESNPDFANTIEKLEASEERIDRIATIFFNLHGAESSDELQDQAKLISPMLSNYSNDIALDEDLFKQVKKVYEKRDELSLDLERGRLLEETYKSFTRNGALLQDSDKDKIRKIDEELSRIGLEFSDNVLKDTNSYQLLVTDEKDIKDLPKDCVEAAKELAKQKNESGWIFTLQFPSYVPFMGYCSNAELRETLFKARMSLATKGETSNIDRIKKIVNLRHDRAKLLGYKNHAAYILEERMAKDAKTVTEFLNYLLEKSLPKAKEEIAQLQEYKKKLGGEGPLQKWDYAYYYEKLKKEKFDFDSETFRPYFKLENVMDGVFTVAKKLYGLNFENIKEKVSVYHEDVEVYDVKDVESGEHIGLFYFDLHPRDGKRSGAWMTIFKDQGLFNQKIDRPHVAIVCNFPRPTKTRPALLSFNDVNTLFHEFGHALHGLLSNCKYRSLSGTNVYWDFVELPSQVMENWVYEKECLDIFAKHFETNETIPQEFIDKLRESSKFHEAYRTVRQLSFGILDMAFHGDDVDLSGDLLDFEKKVLGKLELFTPVPNVSLACSFSHIFSGGYSAGYYSYKWAEVLDADAFELFKKEGIFNSKISQKFRKEVLSRGGVEHPMKLYENFRGRKPDPDALLRRAGLI